MISRTAILAFCIIFFQSCGLFAQKSDISFCLFDIEDYLKRAHADFSIVYEFEISPSGQPVNIRKLLDRWVGETVVSACIQRWRIPSLEAGAKLKVVQRWEHGRGWVALLVTGKSFSQRISLVENSDLVQKQQAEREVTKSTQTGS